MMKRKLGILAVSLCLCFASACAASQTEDALREGEGLAEETGALDSGAEETGTPEKSEETVADETGAPEESDETGAPEEPDETGAPKESDETGAPEEPDETGAPEESEETGAPEEPDETGADETGAGEAAELPRHDSGEDILLIVDFQNVNLPEQAWACPTMDQAMADTLVIAGAVNAPDYVLTRFIAPENPEGCWVRYNEENAAINADPYLNELADAMGGIATDGNVVDVNTYSALDSELVRGRLAGKKRIALAGVSASCCVLATMLDAIDEGYEVIYLEDCISGYSEENERMIRELAEAYAPVHTRIMRSGDYLRSIAAE